MNTLYLECYAGISGDMMVAALIDLGIDQQFLLDALKSLHVDGYTIEISRVKKCGLDSCDFNVILENEHLHNHEHLHGHKTENSDSELHNPIQIGSHVHRNLYDINLIIDSGDLTNHVKDMAKKIFLIVAEAEAEAHGLPLEQVHFHEVGAVDSIVDIVAAAICLDQLNINDVIVSELYEGHGHIKCQHGILPVPVPAVVNIVTKHQLPIHITEINGELVTPTGAAIAASIRTKQSLPKYFNIKKIGLGAGKRNYEHAGILRAMLIEEVKNDIGQNLEEDQIWALEANLDDCTGEALGIAMELLLEAGAKDVYYTPVYMKKNRPAYLLGVLCADTELAAMEKLIFTHTTTIGIRKTLCTRSILPREIRPVVTSYGTADIKVCHYQGKTYYYPEYESIKKLTQNCDLDYTTIYRDVQLQASQLLSRGNL